MSVVGIGTKANKEVVDALKHLTAESEKGAITAVCVIGEGPQVEIIASYGEFTDLRLLFANLHLMANEVLLADSEVEE